ncbi:outer membrane protein [Mangrovimonas sp. TPBH4]|uniref:outer membrane protein n=1 Tax=Mangrovimonas sp. TPBH4 TaxID=1645914 RepID=UPI0006B58A99|nr:outer membrane beta-barrel protein [Mangrovimonas sp. TPBH4]
MKTNYVFLFFLFVSLHIFSQERKSSLEINYPLAFDEGYREFKGIIDVGYKYRFSEAELFVYGASLTFDYIQGSHRFSNEDLKRNYYFGHANAFAEMTIPSVERLHPYAAVGFTYLNYDYEYLYGYDLLLETRVRKKSAYGFNLKLGVQYDVTNSFFVQTYFHYVRVYSKGEIDNKAFGINYNQLKFGVGFRF